jgi:hypothetical protein
MHHLSVVLMGQVASPTVQSSYDYHTLLLIREEVGGWRSGVLSVT